MRNSTVRISIYNPNVTNPYAVEVANLLATKTNKVTLWNARSNTSVLPPNVHARPVLAAEKGSQAPISRALARVMGPLHVALSAGRRDVLIVAWIKDPWDAFVMTARAALVGRTLVVHHNPPQIRGESRIARQERSLLRVAYPIVHTQRLREVVALEYPSVKVAGHPPYANTIAHSFVGSPTKSSAYAFVGKLRPDKGADLLTKIAASTSSSWTIRFIGAGEVPAELSDALVALGVSIENRPEDYRPDDATLVRSLSECCALIAPYTAVTTSGTIILAESLGLPVIRLDFLPEAAGESQPLEQGIEKMARQIDGDEISVDAAPPRALEDWFDEVQSEWMRAIEEIQ